MQMPADNILQSKHFLENRHIRSGPDTTHKRRSIIRGDFARTVQRSFPTFSTCSTQPRMEPCVIFLHKLPRAAQNNRSGPAVHTPAKSRQQIHRCCDLPSLAALCRPRLLPETRQRFIDHKDRGLSYKKYSCQGRSRVPRRLCVDRQFAKIAAQCGSENPTIVNHGTEKRLAVVQVVPL